MICYTTSQLLLHRNMQRMSNVPLHQKLLGVDATRRPVPHSRYHRMRNWTERDHLWFRPMIIGYHNMTLKYKCDIVMTTVNCAMCCFHFSCECAFWNDIIQTFKRTKASALRMKFKEHGRKCKIGSAQMAPGSLCSLCHLCCYLQYV